MQKTILVTGSTDGIGLATADMLFSQGHNVLLHGRNTTKLAEAEKKLSSLSVGGDVEGYLADLSRLSEAESLANKIIEKHPKLDVLINNAGVFRMTDPLTEDGLDARFAVNTIAPYILAKRLLPVLGSSGRVVNLSSAAQASVDLDALAGRTQISDDFNVYAQSKLALTMWSRSLALWSEDLRSEDKGPVIIAVNPGSLLGSKMVTEGFGVAGGDISIGADILTRVSLDDEFAEASGQYFDNDSRQFTSPHADALDEQKCGEVIQGIEAVLASI